MDLKFYDKLMIKIEESDKIKHIQKESFEKLFCSLVSFIFDIYKLN